jgi:hypothetical protein
MSRPRKKAELIEGPQALKNFESAMKAVFRVPKAVVEEAEKKYRERRKRNKS